MAMTIHVDVVSAEKLLYSGIAEFVIVPGVRIKVPDQLEEELIYVNGGLVEIQPDVITILSDTGIRGKDLDEAKALEAKQAAEEAMKNRTGAMEIAQAQIELAQAVAQLQAIQKLRKG